MSTLGPLSHALGVCHNVYLHQQSQENHRRDQTAYLAVIDGV